MNEANDNFGELLQGCAFDDSIREQHRREVRERAMQAFDEAAAAARTSAVVVERPASKDWTQRWTKRQLVRRSLAMAVAASLLWGLNMWRLAPGPSAEPSEQLMQLAAARSSARDAADERLATAIDLLSTFNDEHAAQAFAQGIDVCVSEHNGRLTAIEHSLAGVGS
ncbi:hypothetical protein [Lacipirellula parvula]|uniref:Uncharacterized protein n=1 Tax=Lacipirellula parvula TaxID=2650471 RepID=A0A5K7XAX6_9BACT|nr:hypothetical protein [Lacipirellula parvula]BBO33555.1 hypothetical protein PLANPX_3167 [Lacipirellula parvula]